MLEYLPKELREGLEAARRRAGKRRSRLRIEVGQAVFPVLRFWEDGLALDAATVPRLRGLVDLYDGARHVSQCLIVASGVEGGELVCAFKRISPVADRPAADYARTPDAPAAYLPRP